MKTCKALIIISVITTLIVALSLYACQPSQDIVEETPEAVMETNKEKLVEVLDIDDGYAQKIARIMNELGAGRFVDFESEVDDKGVIVLTITDEHQDVFRLVLGSRGSIGSIRRDDINGELLYSPPYE